MKVLLIGGPKCGQVVDVPPGAASYVTRRERPLTVYDLDAIPALPQAITYRIERYIWRQVGRVALLPVGYCWDRPEPEDLEWYGRNDPLVFMSLELNLEWRETP